MAPGSSEEGTPGSSKSNLTPVPTKNTFVHFDADDSTPISAGPPVSTAPPSFFQLSQASPVGGSNAKLFGRNPPTLDEEDETQECSPPPAPPLQSPPEVPAVVDVLPPPPQQSPATRRPPPLSVTRDEVSGAPPPPQSPPPQGMPPPPPQSPLPGQQADPFPPPPQSPAGAIPSVPLSGIQTGEWCPSSPASPPPPQSPVGAVGLPEFHPPPPPQSPRGVAEDCPSVGSKLHFTGECVPCAWFHKPEGCRTGRDCTRCHLCPPGEVKARKKLAKESRSRKEKAKRDAGEPAYINVGADRLSPTSSGAATGKSQKNVLDEPEAVPQKNTFIHYSDPETQFSRLPAMYSAPSAFLRRDLHSSDNLEVPKDPSPKQDTEGEKTPNSPQSPEMLSAHERGECKPCSYFWYKEDGCRNGNECAFCHLCEKGESKKRKKERIRQLKATGQYQAAKEAAKAAAA